MHACGLTHYQRCIQSSCAASHLVLLCEPMHAVCCTTATTQTRGLSHHGSEAMRPKHGAAQSRSSVALVEGAMQPLLRGCGV